MGELRRRAHESRRYQQQLKEAQHQLIAAREAAHLLQHRLTQPPTVQSKFEIDQLTKAFKGSKMAAPPLSFFSVSLFFFLLFVVSRVPRRCFAGVRHLLGTIFFFSKVAVDSWPGGGRDPTEKGPLSCFKKNFTGCYYFWF